MKVCSRQGVCEDNAGSLGRIGFFDGLNHKFDSHVFSPCNCSHYVSEGRPAALQSGSLLQEFFFLGRKLSVIMTDNALVKLEPNL